MQGDFRRQLQVEWSWGGSRLVLTIAACWILGALSTAAAQTVIVDNTDSGFSVLSREWSTASADGQYGSNYRYRSTSQAAGVVEWRPTLLASGEYEVAVWYRSTGSGRPSDAHYVVEHAGGTTDVYVNQQVSGSQWIALGNFELGEGDSHRVTLTSEAEPGKTIVADAVRFRALFGGSEVPAVRACWLTHYTYLGKTEGQLRAMAQNIKAGNMNTVYISAYSGATVYWPSRAYSAAGGSWGVPGFDMTSYLLDIFHDEGLEVGAWFEYGLALGQATHPIALAHPEWLARDIGGDPVTGENGGFVFLSPGHPEAVEAVVSMLRELAENYDFDDIQLDRIRWGRKTTGREYGYEQATSDLYFAQYGVAPPADVNHPTWVAFRESLVNEVMQQCYDAVKQANPAIVVSSAPTGSYGITQHMQRWSAWVNGGYMDLVMPQMYKTSYSAFVNEFNTQRAQAPGHLDKLGVGYRASEDDDWSLVGSEINYAQSQGVPHGCLWVYHQYTSQIAIQDEIDNLPVGGEPWEQPAYNPFASDRMVQLVVDNSDGSPAYQETGTWTTSAQPDYLKFDSRVAQGGADFAAEFRTEIPRSGRYDVYVWYTSAGNRNAAASYEIDHYNGTALVTVDQRSGGGQWVNLDRCIFEQGPIARRLSVATTGSGASEYTSADGFKLVLAGYALGDADGDEQVDLDDYAVAEGCLTGPAGASVSEDCEAFDFDDDGDYDLLDFAAFQRAVTSP